MAVYPSPRRLGVLGRELVAGAPASTAVGVVGAVAIAGYLLLSTDTSQGVAYIVLGALTFAVMVVATWRRGADGRSGWYLLAAGQGMFVLGDVVNAIYAFVLHDESPFPPVTNVVYLCAYLSVFAGVAKVTRLRSAPGGREFGADAAIVAVGAFALSWQLLLNSYAHDTSLTELDRVITLTFPVLDIGVLFIVVNALMVWAVRRPADTLLASAVVVMFVADFLLGLVVLHSGQESAKWVHPLYLVNYVLLAAAATHPSTAVVVPQVAKPHGGRLWLPLVGLAMSVSPGLVLVCTLAGVPVNAGALAGMAVVIVVLVVLRASWLVQRLRRQADELVQRGDSLLAALATQQDLEHDIRYQAFHDSLTGLANRALLQDRVEHALEAATRRPGTVALCFCDLDGFKEVNDGCGHLVGDQLLVVAGKRIASVVRSGDTVARLGGDEFAVLLENVEDPAAVTALAERIVWVLRQPVVIDDRQLSLSASVGVAFAGPSASTERLLAEADAAMYEAKANGKDQVALFETEMRARLVERMTLTNAFRTALQDGEFFLEFQPQVRLTDGALEGFEALVRWQHPTLGLLSPLRFIPLAEDTGFIVPLGRWVLEQACHEAAGWRGVGTAISVSVNVSSRQLQNAAFCQDVRTALSFSGLAPQRLIVEITESVLMVDPAATTAVLAELKELGVRIAIDDFGTGYSSLSYLRQFPTDILKIDKSFIDLLDDPSTEARALIQTILRLAEDLHLDAVAEGIEHEQQREILQQLRCPSAQGYLMSRPLSNAAARVYIAKASGVDHVGLLAG